MWQTCRNTILAATLPGVAALCIALAGSLSAAAAEAREDTARILGAEILVVRADLAQIAKPDLPPMHREGFVERIRGALGMIPWLLIAAGDSDAGAQVQEWQSGWTGDAQQLERLDSLFAKLSTRHPLDTATFDIGITRAELAEARAIHEAYCAGCHDGFGTGDPEVELAARDLFWMARDEATDQFLARLVNGVKGDETIGFVNPLTEKQIAALWKLYTFH